METRYHAKYVLAWCALCAAVCLVLISLDNWVAARFGVRPWSEIVYNGRLALCTGAVVSLGFALSYALELGIRPALRGLVLLLILVALGPHVWEISEQLAAGEGVAKLRVPRELVQRAVFAALLGDVFVVWLFQRWRPRGAMRALHMTIGALLTATFCAIEQLFLRNYAQLTPFVLISCVVVLTSTATSALSAWPPLLYRVSALSYAALLGLLVWGFARPGLVASGRRSVLADETPTAYLDPLLFASQVSQVQFDVSHPQSFRCDKVAKIEPWPALGLPHEKRRNVILISVDALRADAIGKLRNSTSITPNLDRFAKEAVVAERAYTTYPATLFALSGAMNGLLPSEILFAPKPPASLFRVLRGKTDLETAILPSSPWFEEPAIGLYVLQDLPRRARRDAAQETDEMIRLLTRARDANQSIFAWIHYLEPHQPYEEHAEFNFGKAPEDRYDAEVAVLDREVGRLFELLRTRGFYDDSLILFFADHGQALGEHGYYGHHVFLNRWIVDIPFMMHVPERKAGSIKGPVQITDVAATVLHYLDVPPPHVLSGRSLLSGDPPKDRELISEAFPIRGESLFDLAAQTLHTTKELEDRISLIQHGDRRYQPKVSLVSGNYRLIVRRTTGTIELYDLRDPKETRDVTAQHVDLVERLMRDLSAFHHRASERFYCDIRDSERREEGAQKTAVPAAQGSLSGAPKPSKPAVGSSK